MTLCHGWQVGPAEENELILTAVLDALHETLLILLRGQVINIPGCFPVFISSVSVAVYALCRGFVATGNVFSLGIGINVDPG